MLDSPCVHIFSIVSRMKEELLLEYKAEPPRSYLTTINAFISQQISSPHKVSTIIIVASHSSDGVI